MKQNTRLFTAELNRRGYKYSVTERDDKADVVSAKFRAENSSGIEVKIFLSMDGGDIAVRCFSLITVPDSRRAAVLEALNSIMDEYRWVRLYLDEDKELTAAIDASVTRASVGDVATELMLRAVNIVDEVFPRVMRAMWG